VLFRSLVLSSASNTIMEPRITSRDKSREEGG
jgi:hypothetical protein